MTLHKYSNLQGWYWNMYTYNALKTGLVWQQNKQMTILYHKPFENIKYNKTIPMTAGTENNKRNTIMKVT